MWCSSLGAAVGRLKTRLTGLGTVRLEEGKSNSNILVSNSFLLLLVRHLLLVAMHLFLVASLSKQIPPPKKKQKASKTRFDHRNHTCLGVIKSNCIHSP